MFLTFFAECADFAALKTVGHRHKIIPTCRLNRLRGRLNLNLQVTKSSLQLACIADCYFLLVIKATTSMKTDI